MTSELFLEPRLTGSRFEDGAIPLEVLADFAVLSEMIVEVAKWKYREDNPDRKRVPRGFSEGITLKLTGVEEGSAIPVISLVVTAPTMIPATSTTYFEAARQAIINAIGAAEQDRNITDFLPQKFLGYFDRFGRNLLEGEAIELVDRSGSSPVRLTRETRRKLILTSSAQEFTEETSLVGLVHEFDQRDKTFQITKMDGSILRDIPVEGQHYDTILEANNGFRDKVRVRIVGIGRFDRNNRLQQIEKVEIVTILDPLDIGVRIDELKQLREGWLDGSGDQLNVDGLDWLAESFDSFYPGDVKLPYLFPTPEGRVLAEWSFKPWSPSLEIDLATKQAEWHALNVDTDVEESQIIDLSMPDAWTSLAKRIRSFGGEVE